jgi:hypothetical protein
LVQYEYTATIAQLHRAADGDILTTRGVDHSELIDSRETITIAHLSSPEGSPMSESLARLLVLWLNFCTALRPQTTCCQEAIPLPKTHPSRRRVLSPSLPWEEEDTHKRADQRIDSPLLMNGPLLVFWLTQRCEARSASH